MNSKILLVLLVVSLLATGCDKNEDVIIPPPGDDPVLLDGLWERPSDGLVVTISGETGVFTDMGNGGWSDMTSSGIVNIGALKFRHLQPDGELRWSGEELWMHSTLQEVRWATDAELVISEDGNMLTLTSTSPFGGVTPITYIMTREQ